MKNGQFIQLIYVSISSNDTHHGCAELVGLEISSQGNGDASLCYGNGGGRMTTQEEGCGRQEDCSGTGGCEGSYSRWGYLVEVTHSSSLQGGGQLK